MTGFGKGKLEIEGRPTAYFNGAFFKPLDEDERRFIILSNSEYYSISEGFVNRPTDVEDHRIKLKFNMENQNSNALNGVFTQNEIGEGVKFGFISYEYTPNVSNNNDIENYNSLFRFQYEYAPEWDYPYEIEIEEKEDRLKVRIHCWMEHLKDKTFHECTFEYEGELRRP
jgi:hypothetical protein